MGASSRSDLSRERFRRACIKAFAPQAAPGVIDDDSCPSRREGQGIGAAPALCPRPLLRLHDGRISVLAMDETPSWTDQCRYGNHTRI
jgi:hypothetical protein